MKNLYEWCVENNREDILLRWSEKNDIEATEISYGSTRKIWWKCSLNHDWQTSPNKITQKKTEGCPYCSGQKVLIGFNDLKSNNPKIADEWHPFKNGNLKPEDVTSHSNKKVWWMCSLGHEFQAVVGHRTRENRKSRCPYCANKKVLMGFNDLETICPEIVTEWDKEKNENLFPNEVLPSANRKIWWKCKKGHEWKASLNSRIQNGKIKTGCPVCANKVIITGINDMITLYPQLKYEWNYEKNSILPTQISAGSHKKYWWKCPLGHEYLAAPENKTKSNPTRCSECASENQTSFPEQAIYFYLKKIYPDAKNRWIEFGKEIDIYLPSEEIGIEYDGQRFHTNDMRNKELQKDKYFLEKGIQIVRVKEYRRDIPINLEESNVIWVDERQNQYENIEYAIRNILKIIGQPVKISIDLEKDNIKIYEMYYKSVKENSLSKKNPLIANEWNYDKNGQLSPKQISYASGKKVWWICKRGHEYKSTVYSRTRRNTGCPYCSGQKILSGYNDLKSMYPEIAKEWNHQRNTNLLPEKIASKTTKKVWWICAAGHEYESSIAGRTRSGAGCPYCSGRKKVSGINDFATKFPELLKQWDYEKNGDTNPSQVAPFSHRKVWWKCSYNHSYEMSISSKTAKGTGCPYCSGNKILSGYNDLATRFPELIRQWDYEKNGEVLPQNIGPYSTQKVWWKDEKTGESRERRVDSVVSSYVKKMKL